VLIRLTVRRFFCPAPECPVITFAEQGRGPDRAVRAAHPAAGSNADRGRAGAGRARRGPAGSPAGAAGRPDWHAAPDHGTARPAGPAGAGTRGGATSRSAAATPTARCWSTSTPARLSTCSRTGRRTPWRPGCVRIPAPG
jgi:hypothetical protein